MMQYILPADVYLRATGNFPWISKSQNHRVRTEVIYLFIRKRAILTFVEGREHLHQAYMQQLFDNAHHPATDIFYYEN